MKQLLLCLAVFCICAGLNPTMAQRRDLAYSGMFNVGALYGSNKTKLQAQTIHGIKYRGWFAGAGAGIDDYFQQSIPVFLDLRKDILAKENTPFVYLDGGANIVNKGTENEWQKTKMDGGYFFEGGVGYKVDIGKNLALNFAGGYTFKSYEERFYNKKRLPTPPYSTDEWVLANENKYSLNRLVMKVGLQF